MSEVASLELSKELYELSGWEGDLEWLNPTGKAKDLSPQYSLGYLLRKLPNYWVEGDSNDDERGVRLQFRPLSGGWTAGYAGYAADKPEDAYADSPEDAAAKLAIELFKQGILIRESRT